MITMADYWPNWYVLWSHKVCVWGGGSHKGLRQFEGLTKGPGLYYNALVNTRSVDSRQ